MIVATLISNPAARLLAPTLAHKVSAAVGASHHDVLADGIASDLAFAGGEAGELRSAILDALDGMPIDVVVQTDGNRRKRILIADMDSTMIGQECIDELAATVGIKAHVAAITARAMQGEIAFEPALRERVALLAGLPVEIIDKVVAERITAAPGALELVRTMNAHGAWTALVSGGFEAFTGPVAQRLGFREHRANRLVTRGGRLTGEVVEPILGRAAKAHSLHEISARLSLSPEDAIAAGDGANDLDMLALAGSGVAVHAKPAVAAAARMRIDHADLTALLYIQGYREGDIVR